MRDREFMFEADLHLLTTEEGGRKSPFFGGGRYRPQFYLDSSDISTSCFVDVIEGKDELKPGERGRIRGRLLKPEIFGTELTPGIEFKIREGERPVGWGVIRKVYV